MSALGAATQALDVLGLPSDSVALATAVTYPLGVVGVIIAMMLIRKCFVKPCDLEVKPLTDDDHTYIAQFIAMNPAIAGKTIAQIAEHHACVVHRHPAGRLAARGDYQGG